jgi:transketolase
LAKRAYGWEEDAQSPVPESVYENFERQVGERGYALHSKWEADFRVFESAFGDLGRELDSMLKSETPEAALAAIPAFAADVVGLASRDSSGRVENAVAQHFPWLIGGSADLDTSTRTRQVFPGYSAFSVTDRAGRNLHFGVREHAMCHCQWISPVEYTSLRIDLPGLLLLHAPGDPDGGRHGQRGGSSILDD